MNTTASVAEEHHQAAEHQAEDHHLVPEHHDSHDRLLTAVDSPARARVDAIIVPTNREPGFLAEAVSLARRLGSTLVVLCSGAADPEATKQLAAGLDLVVVDITALRPDLLPDFETTRLLAGTDFDRRTDTSLKRNLGLVIARLMAWRRIAFLDDDITVPIPEDLELAAGALTGSVSAVGLHVGGFPDNSVVCHANRETGGKQGTFIGGGALVVGRESTESFFPTIYNEDWFFLLDDQGLRGSALVGSVEQKPYDPYANDTRARAEEFGDTLAEGVFALLDEDRYPESTNIGYWRGFLRARRDLIDEILTRVRAGVRGDKGEPVPERLTYRMDVALRAARKVCDAISPRLCVRYLQALRTDRERWRAFVRGLGEPISDVPQVLKALDLDGCADYVPGSRA
ncbi:hypothetical protein [Saccharothrix variisporea]|uniref:Glycosyl transferase family 2 n=1 Tax=Saccharothrix variisporea TaxID=543527 RepID=A0A495X9U6_9PSEU|nr:hypothetical protein [Saccharothrix variisporea]RKT70399.1 hypothetical protein DFJ66_3659 [Saccharothrix variisporea]